MNLTLNIVRKDLVRMRLWLACWAALLVAPILMGAWFVGHNPFEKRDGDLQSEVAILTGVQVFVAYLLTILVLQEDSVVGTRQFWLTRPISRARLLAAKALSVLVIVGLAPVAVSVPWWLGCGFTAGQMTEAAGETLLVLTLAMLPAAAMATLTDSFARALLWTVALAAVLLFGGFFFTVFNVGTLQGRRDASLMVTRCILAVGAIALGMLALVIVQFFARRRGGWVGAIATLMVIAIVTAARWRSSWFADALPEHHVERASAVTLSFGGAVAGHPPGRAKAMAAKVPPLQRVETAFAVSSVAPELGLLSGTARQRWTWPDGTSIERVEGFSGSADFASLAGLAMPNAGDVRRALASRLGRPLAANEQVVIASAWLPPSLVARMHKEPPKFEARLWWRLLRPELRVEVPLAPGPWKAGRGHGVGVADVQSHKDTVDLTFVSTRPVLLSPLLGAKAQEWFNRFEADRQQWWALLDRERGRVVYLFGERHPDKARAVVINGVKIEWRQHTLVKGGQLAEGQYVLDPDWRMGTSLGVVTMHEEAVFSRDARVDRFELAR